MSGGVDLAGVNRSLADVLTEAQPVPPPAFPTGNASKSYVDVRFKALVAGIGDAMGRREKRLVGEMQTVIDGLRARLDALEEAATQP